MEKAIDSLLQLGLPGVVILVMGFGLWRGFKLYCEVQEKRIAEAREGIRAIEANTNALEVLTDTIRDRRLTG